MAELRFAGIKCAMREGCISVECVCGPFGRDDRSGASCE